MHEMSEGWFKLHRCLFDKAIWGTSTSEQKVILITLLSMANHEEKEWEWNGHRFKAKPGEFVTSLESIVEKSGSGISVQNVRTALKRFEKYEFLTQELTNRGRFIKIVNWGLYQGKVNETNKDPNKELTSTSQGGNKDLTTNKNDKNYKNDKKNIYINQFTSNKHLKERILNFIKMREKINKPIKDKDLMTILNKLKALSKDEKNQIKILENSIENCWLGIYPLKEGYYGNGIRTDYERTEKKFNIKIPEWKPKASTLYLNEELL